MNKLTVENVFKWSLFYSSWFFKAVLWVFTMPFAGQSLLILGHSFLCFPTDVPAECQILDYIHVLMTSFFHSLRCFFFFLNTWKNTMLCSDHNTSYIVSADFFTASRLSGIYLQYTSVDSSQGFSYPWYGWLSLDIFGLYAMKCTKAKVLTQT